MVASHTPPTGDLACNPGMCPDWESNWQPFGSQVSAQSTEPHQPGQKSQYFSWSYLILKTDLIKLATFKTCKSNNFIHLLSSLSANGTHHHYTVRCSNIPVLQTKVLCNFPVTSYPVLTSYVYVSHSRKHFKVGKDMSYLYFQKICLKQFLKPPFQSSQLGYLFVI